MVFNHNQGKDIRDGRVWGGAEGKPALTRNFIGNSLATVSFSLLLRKI